MKPRRKIIFRIIHKKKPSVNMPKSETNRGDFIRKVVAGEFSQENYEKWNKWIK